MDETQATPVMLYGKPYWKVGDDVYVKIGNMLSKVDHFDKNQNPVVKPWSEEKRNATGGQDCTVHVECLQIAGKAEEI